MDSNDLREQLNRLHAELAGAERVDPQNRRLLGDLMQDIKRLLEPTGETLAAGEPAAGAAAAAGPGAAHASLADRLEGLAVQFEADHPALAVSTRRFVDLLGKVGL